MKTTKLTNKEILDLEMQENDAGATTLRGYFYQLLFNLYSEGEGFSGKRPFGNSCWEYEIYAVLVAHKVVKGVLNSEGYIDAVDEEEATAVTFALIDEMCFGDNK